MLNLTALRKRVLLGIEQRGTMRGQDIAYEFATSRRRFVSDAFRTPQMATRWSAAFMKPLVKAGLVQHWGVGLGGEYSLSGEGKKRIRDEGADTKAPIT